MGWKQAVVVVAGLASCEPAREAAAPPEMPEPPKLAAQTRRVEIEILGDFAVAPALPGTEVTTVRARTLRAGKGGVAFFALERPPAPARCIAQVRLRLFVEEWPEGVVAPGRGPVVLALRDVDLAEPFATATIASSESPGRPRAYAFAEEGCAPRGRA